MDLVEELARVVAEVDNLHGGYLSRGNCFGISQAILSRLSSLGLVIVPREPTERMKESAACLAHVGRAGYQPDELAGVIYTTMLAAAATNKPASDKASRCSPADTGSADR